MQDRTHLSLPVRLGASLLLLIFGVELAMMFLLGAFAPAGTPTWVEAVADAGVLTAIVCLFVWKLFVRPLKLAMMSEMAQAKTVLDGAVEAVITIAENGAIASLNPAAERMFGYRAGELTGSNVGILMPAPHATEHDAYIARHLRTGESRVIGRPRELEAVRKDGSLFPIELSVTEFSFGETRRFTGIIRDITERNMARRRVEHLTQLYAVLSNTNQAIVRARSEEELYERLARIPHGPGAMFGAVVRIAGDDGALHASAFSESMRSVAGMAVSTADPALPGYRNQGAVAFREDRIVVDNDVFGHDYAEPWHAILRKAGIRSTAAVPIRRHSRPVGVLAVSATEPDFFDTDMDALLEEMAVDIEFALDHLEAERRRVQTEKALAESEVKFRCLVEQSLTGISIVEDYRFTYVNPRFAEIHGYAPEEMIGLRIVDTIADEDQPKVEERVHKHMGGAAAKGAYSVNARRKDGSTVRIGVNVAPATMEGKPITISMVQDISEREQAQRRIEAYVSQLEAAMLGTVGAVSAMVEMRDPYTAGHERRVGLLAKAIGAEMGLSEDSCKGLEHMGRVHDLGKISIPAEILSKPGRLTEIEFSMIKTHPGAGYEILKDVDFPWPVAEAVLQHHERLDGSGYPYGLHGDDIIVEARILAVADVVEAMGSHRPYRPALGMHAALDEIATYRGVRYDSAAVDACLRLMREKGFPSPQ